MSTSSKRLGFDWEALRDSAKLFLLDRLNPVLMTDRLDDNADYVDLFGDDVLQTRPFLNIGAGDWRHPCWRNHDFVQPPYDKYTAPDYNLDLSKADPWPIPDGDLLGGFTSHTIEHLTDPMVAHIFRQMARALRPGGVFRVTTPLPKYPSGTS